MITSILDEYNKPEHKVHLVVSDNASSMVNGVKGANVQHLSCFLHTLNLVVKNSIIVQESNIRLFGKCKAIVRLYKKSQTARAIFEDIVIEIDNGDLAKSHSMIQDIDIRWNSTFYMIERVVDEKDRLIQWTYDPRVKCTELITLEEWTKLENLVKTMNFLEQVTKQ